MSLNRGWRERFLKALSEVPVVQHACDVAGITRATAYVARKEEKEFAAAWEEAMEAGIDQAEKEAFRRSVIGFEEPVIFQGRLTYVEVRDENGELVLDESGKPLMRPLTVRKHSDQLLSLVLKGRRKAVYADRTELTSPDGSMSPAVSEPDAASRIAQLLALAEQRRKDAEDMA